MWNGWRQGAALEADWQRRFDAYRAAHPELAAEFLRRVWARTAERFRGLADRSGRQDRRQGRNASPPARRARTRSPRFREALPELFGGSADLSHSNLTNHPLTKPITRDAGRQHGVLRRARVRHGGDVERLALHGGFLPYAATFLVFSDYARNALRMSALMRQRVVYVLTHDSIGLGEDGPTHQPIEHVESLRLIPNLDVWRPCDAVETTVAWTPAVARDDGPSVLALSRQALPHQPRDAAPTRGHRPRRLCAGRAGDGAGRGHRRHRLGSEARARGGRAARRRRHRGARRLHALRRPVRAPGQGLARAACCRRSCR